MLALFSPVAYGAVADNLNCVEANRFLETSECINDRQQALDRLIAEGYRRVVAKLGRPAANRIQIPYLRMRLMCKGDIRCDYQWQVSQLATYYRLAPGPRDSLSITSFNVHHDKLREKLKLGECALSTAVVVSCGRGAGETCKAQPEHGSRIVLADDFRGVAAEEIGAVSNTRPGDPILACKGPPTPSCATDGLAGNYWTLMNYRTGDSWQMPDTLRGCGTYSHDLEGD